MVHLSVFVCFFSVSLCFVLFLPVSVCFGPFLSLLSVSVRSVKFCPFLSILVGLFFLLEMAGNEWNGWKRMEMAGNVFQISPAQPVV